MIDTNTEAVERLAERLDRAAGSEVLPTVYLGDRTADWCAAAAASTLRALAAENARLRAENDECQSERLEQARLLGISAERELRLIAERDAAWQAGAEAMRALWDAAAGAATAICHALDDGAVSDCTHLAILNAELYDLNRSLSNCRTLPLPGQSMNNSNGDDL